MALRHRPPARQPVHTGWFLAGNGALMSVWGERRAYWQHFAHGADVGVRGVAPSKEGAFVQAALALSAIAADLTDVRPREVVEVNCVEADEELLLADWLNAVTYEMATRGMLFSKFEVAIEGRTLKARLWGEAIDLARHQTGVEVKGATYTALSLAKDTAGNWVAECVVDV